MIQIFNSAINYDERTELPLSAVKIQEQNICEFTDFPLESIDIWSQFDGNKWIHLLPSEY